MYFVVCPVHTYHSISPSGVRHEFRVREREAHTYRECSPISSLEYFYNAASVSIDVAETGRV